MSYALAARAGVMPPIGTSWGSQRGLLSRPLIACTVEDSAAGTTGVPIGACERTPLRLT